MQNPRNKSQADNAIGYSKIVVTYETKNGAFIFQIRLCIYVTNTLLENVQMNFFTNMWLHEVENFLWLNIKSGE